MSVRFRSVNQLLSDGEQPVAQGVAVVEDPPALAGQEARAVDHVGAVLQERAHQAGVVARVVLQVGVLEDDQVAGGRGDAGADRGALALVLLVLDVADAVRVLGGELAQDLAGAVLRAVVDDDDLDLADAGHLAPRAPARPAPAPGSARCRRG